MNLCELGFFSAGIALFCQDYFGVRVCSTLLRTTRAMAIGEFHPIGRKCTELLTFVHTTSVADMHCPSFTLAPEIALFLALDLHSSM